MPDISENQGKVWFESCPLPLAPLSTGAAPKLQHPFAFFTISSFKKKTDKKTPTKQHSTLKERRDEHVKNYIYIYIYD